VKLKLPVSNCGALVAGRGGAVQPAGVGDRGVLAVDGLGPVPTTVSVLVKAAGLATTTLPLPESPPPPPQAVRLNTAAKAAASGKDNSFMVLLAMVEN
jgi:hypothetical protein